MKHHMMIIHPPQGIPGGRFYQMLYWQCSRCGKRMALSRELFWKFNVLSDLKWTRCVVPDGLGVRGFYDRIMRERYGG